ncbi:MAG: GNAT family N-acetyltransferase [Planctomycetota bacterium]|nr:MAG: GNAT family N-acetyltransferase [Planctomycetota bacterium]REK44462.1 MAG: GNAT family N-acetyltransferase [Planctomycetota bacterium]
MGRLLEDSWGLPKHVCGGRIIPKSFLRASHRLGCLVARGCGILPGMATGELDNVQVRPVAAGEEIATLKLLLASWAPQEQLAQAQRLWQLARERKVDLAGLLVAKADGRLVGAIWAQLQAGRTAVVWLPRLADGQPSDLGRLLVQSATEFLRSQDVRVAQVLGPERISAETAWFEANGFAYLAELQYLGCNVAKLVAPTDAADLSGKPDSAAVPLRFEVYDEASHARLLATLEATYRDTLDCPALNGVRDLEDVLAGYRATGAFAPERWFLVVADDRDVGCLLLADHADNDQYELVYMGIVPAARGRRFGQLVARFAQSQTQAAGRSRLVLAVDAANEPARKMYEACGFTPWAHRFVWLRQFPAST